jgi:ABC-type sugar transport system permease subunit
MAGSDTAGSAAAKVGGQNRGDELLPAGFLTDPPRAPKAEPRSRAPTLAQQRARAAWLFFTPTLVVLILVAAWPLARTIFFSLTDANLGDMAAWKFIGLTNYVSLAQDPLWLRAIINTLAFTVISVAIEIIVTVPLILLVLVLQRRIVSGLTAGAVKG